MKLPEHLVKFLEEQKDTHCAFCRFEMDCNHNGGVRGGPNGPIYPPCADGEPEQYIDLEALQEAYEEAQEDD